MTAMKSVMGMVKHDWKTQALFWSMLVCVGLIISMIVLLSRMV
ncbi:MAG: hypothetical protein ACYDHZ_08225 [Dehalococcoidia bacterium]|jgi:hypothetical protein